MNRFKQITAIVTLALVQQIVHAGTPQDKLPALTVRFDDLDIDHTPGATVLYQRVMYAAEQVCSSLRGRELKSTELFGRCMREAVGASIAKIDRPVLTKYYLSVSGSKNSLLLAKN